MGWGARTLLGGVVLLGLGTSRAPSVVSPTEGFSPGAALRLAHEAQERGELEQAARDFAEVARREPLVSDYGGWLEARAWLASGNAEEAVRAARRALEHRPDSPLGAALYRILAESYATIADDAGSRAAWQTAIERARGAEEQAALRLALGGSLESAGLDAEAAAQYRTVWAELAAQPEAEEAERRLEALERKADRAFRGPRDHVARAKRLLRARRNLEALAEFDRALAGKLPAREARRARRQRAHVLFQLRRYPEAERAFAALGKDAEAQLWRARAVARSGRVDEAIRRFEKLARGSHGVTSERARFLAGLLLEGQDRLERAAKHYAALADQTRSPSLAAAALWRLGWTAYRDGRGERARALFARLADQESDPLARLRARYWAARALEGSDADAARAELASIAGEYPFSYYGWRAAQRVGAGILPADSRPPVWRGEPALPDRALERVRILLEGGLDEPARRELSTLARDARGLEDRVAVGRLALDARDFHRAQRLIVDAYAEALARGPVPGLEELWWLAWPDAYREWVEDAVPAAARIEPELILAVMREESGYRPEVVSSAGAFGLLQIMPTTGERLARELGWEAFSPDDLFTPPVNLRLGGFYLDRLAGRFPGHVSAAIASYNAGPEAVGRWIHEAIPEDDVWVESIPYQQTRSYVRRVLRSLHVYRALY